MAGQTPRLSSPAADAIATRQMLTLLAVAGFSGVTTTRLCDAMLPALVQAFSVSIAEASVVISAFAVAYGLMQLVYGPLGDRYGKPRVIAIATACCALASLAAAAAPTLQALTLARIAIGASAAAIVPLALAWIGDTVPMAQRQVVLARYSSATVSGIMLGAWAGGFLTQMLSWRATFLVFVPLYAAVAIILWRRVKAAESAPATPAEALPYRLQLAEMLRSPWAQVVLGGVFLEALFTFGFLAFLPTVLHTQFDMQPSYGGGVLALFGLGGLVFSRVAPLLLRRITPAVQARTGGILLALGFAMLVWMPHWAWAIAGCLFAGFGFYTLHNTMQFSATQLSVKSRGMGVSIFACFLFIGQSVGVILAAQIFVRWGPTWGFAMPGMALTLIGLFFAQQLRRREALNPH